jgi:4'-phosphopantetheinyl transferase
MAIREACWRGDAAALPLGAADVHVWGASLPAPRQVVARCREVLAADERERAARMLSGRARDAFVVSRGVLRALLGCYLGAAPEAVPLAYSVLGRPVLASGADAASLQFSVSHSDSQMVLAFTREAPVGVDVERIRPTAETDAIAARFFAPAERAALAALEADDRMEGFFACWTRKEALLKAVGLGISGGLGRIAVTCHPREPARITRSDLGEIELERWSLVDLPAPAGFRAALAAGLIAPVVTCFEGALRVVAGGSRAYNQSSRNEVSAS